MQVVQHTPVQNSQYTVMWTTCTWDILQHQILMTPKIYKSRYYAIIGHINSVRNSFSRLDSLIENRLFIANCSCFHGCELWDLDTKEITAFCAAWRKGRVGYGPYRQMHTAVSYVCQLFMISSSHVQFSIFLFAQQLMSYSVYSVTWSMLWRFSIYLSLSLIARNAIICSLYLHMKFNTAAMHKLSASQLTSRFASPLSNNIQGHIICRSKALSICEGISFFL